VRFLCLSPDERHLVSASKDYSVRIWDLESNKPIGDPLLHNDELWALVISADGKWIASAGLDAKVYVWDLEAALKEKPGDQVRIPIAIVGDLPEGALGLVQSADDSNTDSGAKRMASCLSSSSTTNLTSLLEPRRSVQKCLLSSFGRQILCSFMFPDFGHLSPI
jgi:WD40 repeat protein